MIYKLIKSRELIADVSSHFRLSTAELMPKTHSARVRALHEINTFSIV